MNTPFDVVYEAIVNQLANDDCLGLKAKNLIHYHCATNDPATAKGTVMKADLPEFVVSLAQYSGNLNQTSCSMSIDTSWQFVVATGQFDSKVHHQLMFCLIRLMCDWKNWLAPLTWCGTPFVKNVQLTPGNIGLGEQNQNREICGWASIVSYDIRLSLNPEDVKKDPAIWNGQASTAQ